MQYIIEYVATQWLGIRKKHHANMRKPFWRNQII